MNSIQKYVKNQTGSTLTGFIIGLVIGLSIAVVVALVINKASTPFTNKNAVADKSEKPTTQMQDPNQPMYGNKVSVAQPEKDAAKPATNPSNATNATTTATDTKLDTNIGTSTKPVAVDDKSIYFIQVGAFNAQSDAEGARARLALIGVEAAVTEKPGDGATMYRVRIGPFENAETMNKMRSKLTENGIDVSVIKSAK